MTILVTGAAGFIGSNFTLNWLSHSNEQIIALDKLTYAGNLENLKSIESNPNYIFVQGDIGDSKLTAKILKEYQPRAILNFAAESHVDRSIYGPDDFIQTNILGTYHFLKEVRTYFDELSVQLKNNFRFLHVSTDEVFGTLNADDPPFNEVKRYEPNSPYSASKAASDHLVRAWYHTYGLPVITTHCSNNYGPFHFPEKLIPLCILNALKGKSIPLYGDGMQVRDWLYVVDHCKGVEKVLEGGRVGETYNIGGFNEKTNLEVVHTLCELLDEMKPNDNRKSYKDQIIFVDDRPGHDIRYAIDSSKISNDLDWKPEQTFSTGIKKTVQWYIDNQEWVKNVQSGEYKSWIAKKYS